MRSAILATIAYHDVLGLPLTRFEVERYLIASSGYGLSEARPSFARKIWAGEVEGLRERGAKFSPSTSSGTKFCDVNAALEELKQEKRLRCLNGFWCLPGREHLVAERIEKHKLAETKWKILQRWGRLLAYVPFVRAVFVSGSLVFHNVHEGSDLDILIITKYGRIWTTRALTTGLLGLFGRRRHGTKIKNRICFNHFLTDQSLRMSYPSLYNAVTYSRLVPLLELGVTYAAFLAANDWIGEYLYRQPTAGLISLKAIRRPFGSAAAQRIGEWMLKGWLGNQLEQWFKRIQRRRIEADPRSFEPGGRVVADDMQLEFHPGSPESAVVNAYHERLRQLGMPELTRSGDSSLEAIASG